MPGAEPASDGQGNQWKNSEHAGLGPRRLLPWALLPIVLGLGMALWSGPIPANRAIAQSGLALAGLGWLGALVLAARAGTGDRRLTGWVVGGALLLRLIVLVADPGLSDDVYRYLWEGSLVGEGKSPYAHAPQDPARAEERERWAHVFEGMNNVDVSAAYPPAIQLAFAAILELSGGVEREDGARALFGMRLAFTLCDLAILWVLIGELRRRGRSTDLAVLWAWSPLVALEFAGSAHFDVLGILLLLLGVLLLERAREAGHGGDRRRDRSELWSAVLLSTAALVKLLPLAVFPLLLRSLRSPLRWCAALFVSGLLWFLPLVFWEGGFRGLFDGVSEYALRWESTSLVFRWIESPLAMLLGREGSFDVRRLSRGIVVLLLGVVLLRAWRRRAGPVDAARTVLVAFLLLTPTLHPWYLTWLAPFLVLRPSWSWPLLFAAAPLFYWPLTEWQARGVWVEPSWLWPAVALPFLLFCTLEWVRDRRQAQPA